MFEEENKLCEKISGGFVGVAKGRGLKHDSRPVFHRYKEKVRERKRKSIKTDAKVIKSYK